MINIHPFPARMAPEVALAELQEVRNGATVLDPMTGSGTVARVAAEQGQSVIASDLDPLAVLITKVWTRSIDPKTLIQSAQSLVSDAMESDAEDIELPWIDNDEETAKFIDFWFAPTQRRDLRRLVGALHKTEEADRDIADALKVAISRLIIRKDNGASLAADVSHSRPHKVRESSDFDVMSQFSASVRSLSKRLNHQSVIGQVSSRIADARGLAHVQNHSVDAIVTSPPYLNAIDYMRGHKLSLVWLGFNIRSLREIRCTSIGTERPLKDQERAPFATQIAVDQPELAELPLKHQGMIDRYSVDALSMMTEFSRVLQPKGKVVLVIGDSCLKGVFVRNSRILRMAGEKVGFELVSSRERIIPASKRYLPPPQNTKNTGINNRMKTEVIQVYRAAA